MDEPTIAVGRDKAAGEGEMIARRLAPVRAMAWAAALWLAGSPAALAQTPFLDEARFGALVHSIEPGGSEDGLDLNAELLFRRPATVYGDPLTDFILRPRVHVGASINTIGDTSQLYAGFTWDFKLAPNLSLEVSLGGALHDGPGELYGCALNFRESVSLGLALDERWTLYGTVAHMSNAGLCDNNEGLTTAGVRLGYKLK